MKKEVVSFRLSSGRKTMIAEMIPRLQMIQEGAWAWHRITATAVVEIAIQTLKDKLDAQDEEKKQEEMKTANKKGRKKTDAKSR